MTSRSAPVSDRTLELLDLGELDGPERADLEARLASDAGLAARLDALRASNREILASHPPAAVAAEIRRRAAAAAPAPARPRGRLLLLAAPALAGAVALALWVRPGGDEERIKGAVPQLLAMTVRQGRPERLVDGAAVGPGEAVQLAYLAAGRVHGVIVSVDARASVTLHWPEEPGQPARLEPGGPVALPHAFQLDAEPGFERFVLVAASRPVDVARVMEAARAAVPGQPLRLPAGWHQSSIHLRKVAP
ncbi:MAG: hypothetical protein HZB56_17895 [Deltaproteobacteria bacterium]|nr:hypothetical protein [Deltaproteobacteria bacterium]